MKRLVVVAAKLGALVAVASLLLLDASCGGPDRKLIGTWNGTSAGGGKVSVTFNKDGTGTTSATSSRDQWLASFKWRVEKDDLIVGEQRYKYKFDRGKLVTDGDTGSMVLSRVK